MSHEAAVAAGERWASGTMTPAETAAEAQDAINDYVAACTIAARACAARLDDLEILDRWPPWPGAQRRTREQALLAFAECAGESAREHAEGKLEPSAQAMLGVG